MPRRTDLLARLALVLVSSGITLYAVEAYLEFRPPPTKLDTVLALRMRGIDAYPAYTPAFRQHVGTGLMPLSGVRLVTTVLGGDVTPVVYQSDEVGFRNPTGLWDASADLALLGDSFAQGYGAPAGADIASVMRESHPRTVNLGMTGTGQLTQLAIAREFLPRLRARRVVLLYFEANDVFDTAIELLDPDLARYYFDDGYQQRLADQVVAMDAALREAVNVSLERERAARERATRGPLTIRLRRIARLTAFRSLLNTAAARRETRFGTCRFTTATPALRVVVDDDARSVSTESVGAGSTLLADAGARRRAGLLVANVFSDRFVILPERVYAAVLGKLRSVVQDGGGRLYFAYLPSLRTAREPACDPNYDAIRDIVRAAGIVFIDVGVPLRAAGDLRSLYEVEHLTPKGYRVVADAILAGLAADGDAGVSARRPDVR